MRTKTRMDYAVIKKLDVSGISRLADLYVGNVPFVPAPVGSVFFVNGITWDNGFAEGNDNNPGTFEEPFMTLTAALAACTDEALDRIYLLDYYQPTGETWPVSINKSLVNIIGIGGHFSPLTKWICMYAVGAHPCIDVVADCVYIEGVGFFPNAAKAGVTLDDGKKMLHLHNCYFPQGTYGLHAESGDWSFNLAITDSFFLSSLSSGAVLIDDDPPGVYLARNLFDRHAGVSIDIRQGAYHQLLDNRFALKTDTEGLAITLASAVSRAFVDGNHAAYGAASGGTSPYKDAGTVTTNNWGLNYKGKAAIDPA